MGMGYLEEIDGCEEILCVFVLALGENEVDISERYFDQSGRFRLRPDVSVHMAILMIPDQNSTVTHSHTFIVDG